MGEARARNPGAALNWQVKCHSVSQPLGPVGNLQVPCELGGPQAAVKPPMEPSAQFLSFLAQRRGCWWAGGFLGLTQSLPGLPSGGQL